MTTTVYAKLVALIRPEGWSATSDEGIAALKKLRRSGRFYRGMTNTEYQATVGRGKPVQSRRDFSLKGEGTSFAEDPETAESYVNFGRDDPRKTGKPNWMVEVKKSSTMYRDRDGYTKDHEPVPATRVWKFFGKDGAVYMEQVK